jgi:type I restriction enzyme R subunit
MSLTPEERARQTIDGLLSQAGWIVQDRRQANIDAARGVAVREFSLGHGYGEADYLLFIDGQAVGVVEAKKEGTALVGVEIQTQKYTEGIPEALPAPVRPLPFCYQSTGSKPASRICWSPMPPAGRCSPSILRPRSPDGCRTN